MKKILSALLVFAMVIACFAFTTSAAYSGTPAEQWWTKKDAIIEVDTAEKLVAVFNKMATGGETFSRKTIRLTADIVINEGDFNDWEKTAPKYNWFKMFGNDGVFSGTFDGNGHTISGLYCNSLPEGKDHIDFGEPNVNNACGLFPKAEGATITNLRITNSYFTGPYGTAVLIGNGKGNTKIENVQIDTTKVFGTYAQMVDDKLEDIVDVGGPYEKHSSTGALIGQFNGAADIIVKNAVYQGTLVGGGRFVGGLFGNLSGGHLEVYNSGFIGVYESFYSKYYNGVNLFKENSGGLIGRTNETNAETGVILENCFFIGSFKANEQSTTSGSFIGRCTLFTADNCWTNEDSYKQFYDSSKTNNSKGEAGVYTTTGFNESTTAKLTGKDCVVEMGLDDKVYYAEEGIGPMLLMFKSEDVLITTAPKTTVGEVPGGEPAPSTTKGDNNDAPASTNGDSVTPSDSNSAKPSSSKKPAANTGDITVYMIAAVMVSAAAAVVISKKRINA